MTNGDPSGLSGAIPKDISEILKREFNTGVPQIATLAAIIAGTFGVPNFDAGVWTVVAIMAFVIVFLFQQQIPNSVPRTSICVFVLFGLTVAVLAGIHAYWGAATDLASWCPAHPKLMTGMASAFVTASIALLMVSYRKQQRFGAYPSIIDRAVSQQLKTSPFYKRKVMFKITVQKADGEFADFETTHSYEVVNRFDDATTWLAEYELNDPKGKVMEVTVDGVPENIHKFAGSRVVRVPISIKGHDKRAVVIKVRDRFRVTDSDIYTSYHPATDLKVEFTCAKKSGLDIEWDTLHVSRYSPTHTGDTSWVYIPDGILPFEGVRLRWRPT